MIGERGVNMTYTINNLKEELTRLQQAQNMCIDEHGYIYSHYRYKYQMLVEQIRELKSSIEWLDKLKGGEDEK